MDGGGDDGGPETERNVDHTILTNYGRIGFESGLAYPPITVVDPWNCPNCRQSPCPFPSPFPSPGTWRDGVAH